MQLSIVKIGNSKGVRLPKSLLEQCGLEDRVDVEVRENRIILSTPGHSRSGWNEAFQAMHDHQDDLLLDDSFPNEWDESEWEWK